MANLEVTSVTIPELLRKLKTRAWLVPQFQREFVWSTSNVIDLVNSIFDARPIGMATLWEQEESSALALEPISIPDHHPEEQRTHRIYFTESDKNPNKLYAVLDGRQRCTAISMAFGGFHSKHGLYKYSGRYYLNVAESDPVKRVLFIKETDVKRQGLDRDATCIARGLFPLASNNQGEEILQQWMRYLQALRDPAHYANGRLPEETELARRDSVIKKAFEGLVNTKLAVYIVPETYTLSEICEIFETLNTTGTKVSTVDLIHSSLYAETFNDARPIHLRDWIAELGQRDGAIGWAVVSERPELIAQIVTACHIALHDKPDPKPFGRGKIAPIVSVKAVDLLSTPVAHWKNLIQKQDDLAELIGDFQKIVAGGYFPWTACPYPVTAAIYVALRWHARFEDPKFHLWGQDELNALFRAFFWRNALSGRYDQGFLTQLGADLKELKKWLNERPKFKSSSDWARTTEGWLNGYLTNLTPTKDDLTNYLTDTPPGGAMQKALMLPMLAKADRDFLDPNIRIGFPAVSEVEIHHIYPKAWCQNNRAGALAQLLDEEKAGRDWVESIANLMPISRQSNNIWKAKVPGQVLQEKKIAFANMEHVLRNAFIDEECFNGLQAGSKRIREFWSHRAELMADALIRNTSVFV